MTFTQSFGPYVCNGDRIECEVDGLRIIATVEYDTDATPLEYDEPGCCYDTTDPEHGEESRRIIEAWKNDEWFYCGVCLTVEKEGVQLTKPYTHALWGIEANFPDSDNAYLTTVANELLPEATADAKETIAKLAA